MATIIEAVCAGCECLPDHAEEYLASELDNLNDLLANNDLHFSDLEVACDNLGISQDYQEYFIQRLASY